jgi:starch synthase
MKAQDLNADERTWQTIQKRGMRSDVSWKKSSGHYAELYGRLVGTMNA